MSKEYTISEAYKLLDNNNVNARVTFSWDRQTNPNCKFAVNETAQVRKYVKARVLGSNKKTYRGQKGTVIAASTPNGFRLVADDHVRRGHTNYYVAFKDGSVHAFESYLLQ